VSTNHCHTCQRSDTQHLGKSSFGWKFLFRGNPNIDDIKKLVKDNVITNEYGDRVSKTDFWLLVATKQDQSTHLGQPNIQVDEFGFEYLDREFC
jgi:hypothetical protein